MTDTDLPELDSLQRAGYEHSINCEQCCNAFINAIKAKRSVVDLDILAIEGCCQEGKILNLLAVVGEKHIEKVIGALPILAGFNNHVSLCEVCRRDAKAGIKPACVVGAVFYEEWVKMAESIVGKTASV